MAQDDPLVFDDNAVAQVVFGQNDRNLRTLEQEVGVEVHARGNRLRVQGPDLEVKVAVRVLKDLYALASAGVEVRQKEVLQAVHMTHEDGSAAAQALQSGDVVEVGRRKRILPRSQNQRLYVQAMRSHDVVFGLGPAGTGKTYLAMAAAVEALQRRTAGRIILTRPAVEAGESLGYLPGTLHEKIDPYLRPLYDALHDMMDSGDISRRMDRGVIEVAPLAFMRGRTLNDAFVILDEAQNTTSEQMRMFLTRLGFDSRAVINGDTSQIDLPSTTTSGLVEASRVLAEVPGISFVRFSEKDVVRHPLVQEIIRAYDRRGGSSR